MEDRVVARRHKPGSKGLASPLSERRRKAALRRSRAASRMAGVYDAEVPPVPIPNTVVKLICAENTWREAARENRSALTRLPRRGGGGSVLRFCRTVLYSSFCAPGGARLHANAFAAHQSRFSPCAGRRGRCLGSAFPSIFASAGVLLYRWRECGRLGCCGAGCAGVFSRCAASA